MGLKYLFMGSPEIAASLLETLCTKAYPPVAVVTQVAKASGRGQKIHSTPVEAYARSQNLVVLETLDVNSPATLDALKTFSPDLILVVAFGQIFRQPILELPRIACLNVHASLLPAYRGAAPVQWSILNGDRVTGVTLQKMVKKLDAGDVLLQKSIPIESDDTTGSVLKKLATLGGEVCLEALTLLESGRFSFTPQDPEKVTFAPKIEKTDAVIDWSKPAETIRNQIRALQPWPVAETHLGKDRLKVFRASVETGGNGGKPGAIDSDGKTYLRVKCGDSKALSLTEIQLENRKRLEVAEFLRAYRGTFPYQRMGLT